MRRDSQTELRGGLQSKAGGREGTRKWAKSEFLCENRHLECRAREWTAQGPVGVVGFKSSWQLIHLSRDSTVWLSFERASALRCALDGTWIWGRSCVGVQWAGDSGSEHDDDSGEGGKTTDPRRVLKIRHSGLGEGLGAEAQGERRLKSKWVTGGAPLLRLSIREGQDHTLESSVLMHQV